MRDCGQEFRKKAQPDKRFSLESSNFKLVWMVLACTKNFLQVILVTDLFFFCYILFFASCFVLICFICYYYAIVISPKLCPRLHAASVNFQADDSYAYFVLTHSSYPERVGKYLLSGLLDP